MKQYDRSKDNSNLEYKKIPSKKIKEKKLFIIERKLKEGKKFFKSDEDYEWHLERAYTTRIARDQAFLNYERKSKMTSMLTIGWSWESWYEFRIIDLKE